jgi:hypothetical protein
MLRVDYSEARDEEEELFCIELVVNTDDEAVLKKIRRSVRDLFGPEAQLASVPRKED